MNPAHLRRLIRETLAKLPQAATSDAAVELLVLTACKESECGRHLYQLSGGPARGIFQMEPATHEDLWRNWLRYRTDWRLDLSRLVFKLRPGWVLAMEAGEEQLVGNLYYAIAAARANYFRHSERLPAADNVEGLASYWHRYWCRGCAGTVREAIHAYQLLGGTP